MNRKQDDFLDKCRSFKTTVAVFIKLFNLWSQLSAQERREIIEYEQKIGRLEVKR